MDIECGDYDGKIIREAKTRLCILLLAFFGSISCIFIYKPNLLIGQVLVKEVDLLNGSLMESCMDDNGQTVLPVENIMIYEDAVKHDYNMITFTMNKSVAISEPYRLQVHYINGEENADILEKTVSDENDSISFFTSMIDQADLIQVYIIGTKGQTINVEKMQLIHCGFHPKSGSSVWVDIFVFGIGLCILFHLVRRYARDFLRIKTLFYYVMVVGIGIYLLQGMLSQGNAVMSTLFLADTNDTFMDFVNSIQYGTMPYEKKVIYPPLINCIFALFGRFIPGELWDTTKTCCQYTARESQYGRVLIAVYIVLIMIFYTALIRELKKGKLIEKYVFLIISVFTIPFLWALERGNIIIVAMCFLLIFVYWYDSDKPVYRHVAMISLAIAVSIKIYPVIFGILLIQKKRWKDVVWCLVYGITIFFLPIIFLGGFKNVPVMIDNIIDTSALMQAEGYGYFLDLKNITGAWGNLLKIGMPYLEVIQNVGLIVCGVGGCILALFGQYEDEWKRVAILCILMVLLPAFSCTYTLIYLLCPLMMFIDKKSVRNDMDYFYFMFFIFAILPFNNFIFFYTSDKYLLNTATLLEGVGLIFMLGCLYVEGVISLAKKIRIGN